MAYKSKGTESLKKLNKKLEALIADRGKVLTARVAAACAVEITERARASFAAGQTVYGDARPEGKHGPLTLVQTGRAQSVLGFTSDGGTKIRSTIGPSYVKYLIGKYRILPIGNQALPFQWLAAIARIWKEQGARAAQKALAA